MNQITLKSIKKETLISLCKELTLKIENHNYKNPDVFALYGYISLLFTYANELGLDSRNNGNLSTLFHHFDKELDIAISSIGQKRKNEFKFLSLLGSALYSFEEDLNKL